MYSVLFIDAPADHFITDFDLSDHDNLMQDPGRCNSCRVPLPNGHNLCDGCKHHRACTNCSRWLPSSLFSGARCQTCLKKKSTNRFAFDGVINEDEIATSECDVDIGQFLNTNAETITGIIQRSITQHT
jgi:hypothetical protein